MEIILNLVLILVLSYFVVQIGKKIRIPGVVMLIALGLVFNIPMMQSAFVAGNEQIISILGYVGLFAMMFLAGLEISWSKLYKEKRNSVFVATFASLTPFLLAFITFIILGFSYLTAAMIGISMAITAEATTARVLVDLKKIKTKLSAAMMGAGIVDDFIGLGLFIIIATIFGAWSDKQFFILGVIGSFFLGIIFNKKVRETPGEKKLFEKFLLLCIVPFFFISMGIRFQFSSLIVQPFIVLIIIALALVGKILGTFLTKHWTHLRNEQLWVVGWAMNSRGAIELALSLIALQIGLINTEIYSSIIIMALVTTLIFPFVITRAIKNNPGVMK